MKNVNEKIREWAEMAHEMVVKLEELEATKLELATAQAEIKALKDHMNDGWTDRVTYDNMVEQIAACEDTKERDEARKLIEPLLKRSTVTKFRRDIRNRAKELNEGNGANITIQHVAGDFAVNKTVNQIGD